MKVIFLLIALIIFNSCGDNSPEPTKEIECGLEYIVRTNLSGQILNYGALRDTNDWKTFANQNAKGLENQFTLKYATPNPTSGYIIYEMALEQSSKVKLYFNDSLMIESYIVEGINLFSFELNNNPEGCYKIKAECYLGQTENSPISNKILTSSGRVIISRKIIF